MMGHGILIKTTDVTLAEQLRKLINQESSPELLVCLSDVFEDLERYNPEAVQLLAKSIWSNIKKLIIGFVQQAFMVRLLYLVLIWIFKDKSASAVPHFEKLKKLWGKRVYLDRRR